MKGQRPYVLRRLREAGSAGVHSWQLRYEGIGNPSERIRELQKQGEIIGVRSEPRDGSPGKRYVLLANAERSDSDNRPQEAVETSPNTAASDIGPSTAAASLCAKDSAEPDSDAGPPAPLAGVLSGSLFDDGDYASRSDYRDTEAA